MTHHDFEKALAALKSLTHNDDETPMMIDMACWLIDHLDEVAAALQAAIAKPAQGVDYIRKDIVPQDRAKEALEAVEYCIKIISNHRIPKQENAIWSSGSSANPRITQETLETILALFVAHGGNE